eukprot:6291680-Prymnesium_polylepis.1
MARVGWGHVGRLGGGAPLAVRFWGASRFALGTRPRDARRGSARPRAACERARRVCVAAPGCSEGGRDAEGGHERGRFAQQR